MSEGNLATVESFFEKWNSGEIEAILHLAADNIVVEHPPGWPEPGPSVGIEQALEQYERMRDTFMTDRIELIEARPVGDNVIVRAEWRAEAKDGVNTSLSSYVLFIFSDRLLTRMVFHW